MTVIEFAVTSLEEKDIFGMPKVLYPCRFLYLPTVPIMVIYNSAELNGMSVYKFNIMLSFD